MNITPDTEPNGSEHKAEGLAQRALELAEWAEASCGYTHNIKDIKRLMEVSAFLKSYAEIAPKWQAVLDSEAVAYATHHDEPMLFPSIGEAGEYCEYWESPIPLIIKPAP